MRLFFPSLMRRYEHHIHCGVFTLKNVKILLLFSMLTLTLVLSGCGVKGDLIYPSEQNQPEQQDTENSVSSESGVAPKIIEQETA